MPDKKFDKKQREAFRNDLLKAKEKILLDIKNMSSLHLLENKDPSTENAGHSMHMADVATDMYDREFNLSLASNDREILQKVNAALSRIEKGTFGFCLKSGKRIPEQRLKAIPYAEYCLEVQEQMDLKGEK